MIASSRTTVVLLDLWTDANRGDCALQSGLIKMVRDRWPGAAVVGVFRFGTNEMSAAAEEVPFTTTLLDRYYGGLRRTYYSARNLEKFNKIEAKLIALYSFAELLALLLLFKIGLRRLLPRSKTEVLEVIAFADIVIWKGKNFRDYGGLAGVNRQLTLLSAGFVGTLLNRNVHCANASVWPMSSGLERFLVRTAFMRCKSISVREPASLAAIERLALEGVSVRFAQDLSFYWLHAQHGASGARRAPRSLDFDVALTITQWSTAEAQRTYLDTLLSCIRELVACGASRFLIVPQVTRAAEDNSRIVSALRASFPEDSGASLDMMPGSPDITTLLDVYERTRLLIGTRMHSCVFAMSVGTPFVAIAYDAGPKWDILKQFWPEEFVFDYSSSPASVAQAARRLYIDGPTIQSTAAARFHALAEQSFDNVRHL